MGTLNVDAINDAAGSITALDVTKEIGIWQFVSTAAITAAANLNVTGIAAGYDYLVHLEAYCPTTDAGYLWMRFSDDGGSSYEAGASDYGWSGTGYGAGLNDAADSEIQIGGNSYASGNDAASVNTMSIEIVNPGGSSEHTTCHFHGVIMYTDVSTRDVNGGAIMIGSTAAINAVQLGWSTNYGTDTFKAQGDITVWRRRRS